MTYFESEPWTCDFVADVCSKSFEDVAANPANHIEEFNPEFVGGLRRFAVIWPRKPMPKPRRCLSLP